MWIYEFLQNFCIFSGRDKRQQLCNTATMKKVLEEMSDPGTKVLKAYEKGFQNLERLYVICKQFFRDT